MDTPDANSSSSSQSQSQSGHKPESDREKRELASLATQLQKKADKYKNVYTEQNKAQHSEWMALVTEMFVKDKGGEIPEDVDQLLNYASSDPDGVGTLKFLQELTNAGKLSKQKEASYREEIKALKEEKEQWAKEKKKLETTTKKNDQRNIGEVFDTNKPMDTETMRNGTKRKGEAMNASADDEEEGGGYPKIWGSNPKKRRVDFKTSEERVLEEEFKASADDPEVEKRLMHLKAHAETLTNGRKKPGETINTFAPDAFGSRTTLENRKPEVVAKEGGNVYDYKADLEQREKTRGDQGRGGRSNTPTWRNPTN